MSKHYTNTDNPIDFPGSDIHAGDGGYSLGTEEGYNAFVKKRNNSKLYHLAEQAGFVLWKDEHWKPEGAVVDWSSEYDDQLITFAELIVRECCEVINAAKPGVVQVPAEVALDMTSKNVKAYFGVE